MTTKQQVYFMQKKEELIKRERLRIILQNANTFIQKAWAQDAATCHTIAESLEYLNEKFGDCFISNKTDSHFKFSKHFVKAYFHKKRIKRI